MMKIKPKQFSYKKVKGLNFPDGTQTGFIAQEIKVIIPGIVNENGLPLPNLTNAPDSVETQNIFEKYLTVDYTALIPYIVRAIQDQQEIIQQQSSLIKTLIEKDSTTTITNASTNDIPQIIKLFPNPAQNQLDIECFTNGQIGTINMYNKDGKVYKSFTIESKSSTISLESFENGLYIVTLLVNGTTFDIKRFIVSK